MIKRKTWDEFRDTGMLYVANVILQFFGWSIVMQRDPMTNEWFAYPARSKYRGFSNDVDDQSHRRIAKYLKDNVDALYNESLEI
ncbi:MAG: hypothetical protein IJA72_02725 [Clostridia bacterium]|nr:hypothetical protein [Clostridia bacterium]